MTGVLVLLAVFAPLVASLVGRQAAFGSDGRLRLTRFGCLAGAVVAVGLLTANSTPEVGPLHPDPLALAAVIGVLVLSAALSTEADTVTSAVVATVMSIGVVFASGTTPTAGGALVGSALALTVAARGRGGWRAAAGAAGLAIAAVAAVLDGHADIQLMVLASGLALTAVAVAARPDATTAVVLPGVLVVGIRSLPALDGAADFSRTAAAVGLALVSLIVAAMPLVRRRSTLPAPPPAPAGEEPERAEVAPAAARYVLGPASCFAPWALAAAVGVVPGGLGAAGLLSAGTTLAVALPAGTEALAVVPGAVALADALVTDAGATAGVIGALAVAVCVLLAGRPSSWVRPGLGGGAAGVLSAWLVLRPGDWAWAEPSDLGAYTDGVAVAVAGGFLAVMFTSTSRSQPFLARRCSPTPSLGPASPVTPIGRARTAAAAAAVALGCASAALVRSGAL